MLRTAVVALAVICPLAASAAPFDFIAAPQTDLNRVYRVDRFNGEVSACQYGLREGTIGVTLCYGPGEGASAQPPGEYALVASRHEREGGVFRVNARTGDMSVCYVFNEQVVCTPQAKTGPVQTGQAPVTANPETTGSIAAPKKN
ncbi:MAG: hypothetical protein ACRCYS_12885 [Beijerinckiaceae bacterium]